MSNGTLGTHRDEWIVALIAAVVVNVFVLDALRGTGTDMIDRAFLMVVPALFVTGVAFSAGWMSRGEVDHWMRIDEERDARQRPEDQT